MCLEPQRKKNRLVSRIAFVGLATGLLAGCSSEVTRFAQGSIDRNPTGTTLLPDAGIGQNRAPSLSDTNLIEAPRASAGPIISSPLPAPNPVYTAPSTPSPLMKGAAAAPSRTDVTAGIAARAPQVSPNWSAVGGTPIVVAKGDSLGAISARYGVPADVLLKTNGLTAAQIEPGMRLVVPVYNASATQAPVAKAEAAKIEAPKLEAPKADASKIANAKSLAPAPQATLTSKTLAPTAQATKPADKTPAVSAQASSSKVAETKAAETKVPAQTAATTPVAAKTANASSEKTAPAKQDVASTKTAAVDRTPVATVTPSNVKEEALSDSANPEFRWPARGRVIQGFKSGSNDGINISLPE
ncbi:MAG: LysM peptidoglycan-binding domain-containing protein, partial [Alphaproteobacteria bacterium]|nr:LysM peptidoglycan-binding domain-containing protein [Alphaproteobacteria bacterium]